jgi:transposase
VVKWRKRFLERGLDGLPDDPRPGTPRSITDDDVEAVIVRTLEDKPTDATRWSTLTDLFAALNLATGQVGHQTRPQHRAVEFRKFLDKIDQSVPADLAVHVVLDNSSTHKTPAIHDWLLKHPRFTFHFTPTSSSWMNLVERWFAELTNKMLKRSAHKSIAALTADLNTWIAAWNNNPKPFVWHKTADQILDSLKKYLTNLGRGDTSSGPESAQMYLRKIGMEPVSVQT